ncbi:MAG TPA: ABC transporter permease [Vicinamibacterales bacterium]
MTRGTLILRSAAYHWRTNVAVVLGVATAVAVLGGALLVGDSVRGSLRDIAVGRLGHAEQVLSSTAFFPEQLAERLSASAPGVRTAPMIIATGFVTHEPSGRRAGNVLVYGVDERFWTFHGLPTSGDVVVSPALAKELAIQPGDVLLTRLQKPSAIPIESLFGRKDDIGRTVRLSAAGVLERERLGEFAVKPQQSEVRAVFAPLRRIQRDLGVAGKANTVLIAGGDEAGVAQGLARAATLEDYDLSLSVVEGPMISVESGMGILAPGVETTARAAATRLGLTTVPVFTYLANTLRKGDREVPYSLITATDLAQLPGAPRPVTDAIVLNEWAARELGASAGDRIDVDYYLWDAQGGLTTHTASFTLDRVVPIAGLAADRRLAPEYPGITEAKSLGDWDPPFPIDLSRVRPQDERYWDDHRTTPKAFVAFDKGRSLWETRYGGATSLRFVVPGGRSAEDVAASLRRELLQSLTPQASGLAITPARRLALEASAGATDFGEYFTYFSFFLVVSALLLAVLFFRLGIEQRLRQLGILRAAGFTIAHLRRLLLGEALLLAAAGSAIGAAGAIAYAKLIVYGLRTWWVGAVGTTLLNLHVTPASIAAGALGGLIAAAICVVLSLRAVARISPRALMTAQAIDGGGAADPKRARRSRRIGLALALAGIAMLVAGFFDRAIQAGLFFGAAASLLAACMFLLSSWLRAQDVRRITGTGTAAVATLGFRSAAHRPSRSVMSAALIASAAFIVVSVDAFRRGAPEVGGDKHSGTGGYALLATSELPLLHDPNEPAGREALIVNDQDFAGVRFTRFRVKPGDDASCLNLYRPTSPTIVAPEGGFVEQHRFTFASSLASTDAERANPWLLLQGSANDAVVPAIADATSLQYVLHLGLGDTMTIDTGGAQPLVVRFVGALSDSVLQGEIVISEQNFVRLFPGQQGYRMFLVDAPSARTAADAEAVAGTLERALSSFGFDAVTTAERIESFHRVENTYLSTFQALGGLGLLLGTIGLSAIMFRNVLERRRELALLRAVGFDARRVRVVIMAEAVLLLAAGLAAGAGCAVLAVAPAWMGRQGSVPGVGLALLLIGVALAGVVSSFVATRAALGGSVLEALRAE